MPVGLTWELTVSHLRAPSSGYLLTTTKTSLDLIATMHAKYFPFEAVKFSVPVYLHLHGRGVLAREDVSLGRGAYAALEQHTAEQGIQ